MEAELLGSNAFQRCVKALPQKVRLVQRLAELRLKDKATLARADELRQALRYRRMQVHLPEGVLSLGSLNGAVPQRLFHRQMGPVIVLHFKPQGFPDAK